jgi:hypothetical protein
MSSAPASSANGIGTPRSARICMTNSRLGNASRKVVLLAFALADERLSLLGAVCLVFWFAGARAAAAFFV